MKVLVLSHEYPPVGGGSGVIVKNIAEGFASRGHEVAVVTTFFSGVDEQSVENNVSVTRLKSRRKSSLKSNPWEMLSWIHRANKFLKKHLEVEKYDVCLANFALPGGEVAYTMKQVFHLPYVVLTHGFDLPWYCPEKMMWYHAACYQWIRKICMQSERNYVRDDDLLKNINAFLAGTESSNKLICNDVDAQNQEIGISENAVAQYEEDLLAVVENCRSKGLCQR